MKKQFLYLVFTLLLPVLAISQAAVTLSKPYRVVDAPDKYYFSEGNEILTVKIRGRLATIQKLSGDKMEISSVKEYEDLPDGYVLEDVLNVGDKYYLFYSLWDKKNVMEQLFYREINFSKGEFTGKDTRIIQVNKKLSGAFGGGVVIGFWSTGGVTDKFDFYHSYDQSKLMIQYRVKPEVKKDENSYDIIGMYVFDPTLKQISGKEHTMPYTEKKMNNIDYSVDSDGNAYILATVYEDNTTDTKKKKDADANYHIELLTCKNGAKTLEKTAAKVGDKFINKVWLFETPKKEMLCAGFYNNGRNLDAANGVFLFKVNNGTVTETRSYEIPVSVLNQFVSERQQKKNDKKDEDDAAEFADLELRNLTIQEDGSILLVGEQYFMRTHTTYSSNGRSNTYYTHHYNDMLVTKIDPAGKLAWMVKLPKRQFAKTGSPSVYKGGMSFKAMHFQGKHYFVFVDNVKNMDLPMNKFPAVHSDGQGGYLTAFNVNDATGKVTKNSICNFREVEGIEVFQFNTGRILPLASDEFVFECYKKKKEDILIKVKLK